MLSHLEFSVFLGDFHLLQTILLRKAPEAFVKKNTGHNEPMLPTVLGCIPTLNSSMKNLYNQIPVHLPVIFKNFSPTLNSYALQTKPHEWPVLCVLSFLSTYSFV